MRCIAVDDEKWALDLVVDNIRHVPWLELVARCKNAREASEVLHREKVDLMFMDVQMPGLSGLQFVQTLPEPPMVILVTAYEEYALEGFNLSVVDYLVKPVLLERFIKACNKAKQLYDLKKGKPQENTPDHIFVNVEYSLVKIVLDDITFIEGLKDYIKIHLASLPRPVLTRMSLKAMEEKLPQGEFIRTHKSYIVALRKVTSVKRDFVCIHEIEIPIGESFKDGVGLITGNRQK
jgi:DNA-binding LytR/AlgR family response regulator